MLTDAKVKTVIINEDGSGELKLINQPTGSPSVLHFDSAPEEVTSLNGKEICIGSESILFCELKFADRIEYTKIEFCDSETFKRVMAN
jgi:hypothetical protein